MGVSDVQTCVDVCCEKLKPATLVLIDLLRVSCAGDSHKYDTLCKELMAVTEGWSPSGGCESILLPVLTFKSAAKALVRRNQVVEVNSALKCVVREILSSPRGFHGVLVLAFLRAAREVGNDETRALFWADDRFVIDLCGDVLGRGVSTVRAAVDLSSMKRAAAKIVECERGFSREDMIRDIENEVKVHREAQGRAEGRVVPLLGTHRCDGSELRGALFVIFMDFVPFTLDDLIAHHGGRLPVEHATAVFAYIAETFVALSDGTSTIAHRDIKPANVLMPRIDVRPDLLTPLMTDFGLSRCYRDGDLMTTHRGTPLTMAPEVYKDGSKRGYTDKADVWSCGVSIFYALTGQYPLIAGSEAELYRKGGALTAGWGWAENAMKRMCGAVYDAIYPSRVFTAVMQSLHTDPNVRITWFEIVDLLKPADDCAEDDDVAVPHAEVAALREDVARLRADLAVASTKLDQAEARELARATEAESWKEKYERERRSRLELEAKLANFEARPDESRRLKALEDDLYKAHNALDVAEARVRSLSTDLEKERALQACVDEERAARVRAESALVAAEADLVDERARTARLEAQLDDETKARAHSEARVVGLEADVAEERGRLSTVRAELSDAHDQLRGSAGGQVADALRRELLSQRVSFEEVVLRLVVHCHRWQLHLDRVRERVLNATDREGVFAPAHSRRERIYQALFEDDQTLLNFPSGAGGVENTLRFIYDHEVEAHDSEALFIETARTALENMQ